MKQPVIVSGARTAIGNNGGSLQEVPAAQLAAIAIKGALKKVGLRPGINPSWDKVAPKVFQGVGMIDLEKKYYDWDRSLKEVFIDEVILATFFRLDRDRTLPDRLEFTPEFLRKSMPIR